MTRFFRARQRFDLVLVFKGFTISPDTIHACRRLTGSVPWFTFNPDSPFDTGPGTSSECIRQSLALYDTYFIWSEALRERLLAAGCRRVEHLRFAYDPTSHFPAPTFEADLQRMTTFVGAWDRLREATLEPLADLPLAIFGNGWDRVAASSRLRRRVVSANVYGDELRRVVSSSMVSINMLRPQNAGAHNMRTFEVPAMGGLMLTTRSTEQQQLFPEEQACLMFDSAEELRHAVLRVSEDAVDGKKIRQRGRELNMENTYATRAQQVLSCL